LLCTTRRLYAKNTSLDFAIFPGLIFHETKYDCNILISSGRDKDIIPGLLTLTPACVPGNIIWKRESLLQKNICWDEKIKAFQDIDFHLLAAYNHLHFEYSNDAPDYFWRKHLLGNTGSELSHEDKLASHEYFFNKHVQLLTEKNLYTHYEKQINRLAGQLLLLAFLKNRKKEKCKKYDSFFAIVSKAIFAHQ